MLPTDDDDEKGREKTVQNNFFVVAKESLFSFSSGVNPIKRSQFMKILILNIVKPAFSILGANRQMWRQGRVKK